MRLNTTMNDLMNFSANGNLFEAYCYAHFKRSDATITRLAYMP